MPARYYCPTCGSEYYSAAEGLDDPCEVCGGELTEDEDGQL